MPPFCAQGTELWGEEVAYAQATELAWQRSDPASGSRGNSGAPHIFVFERRAVRRTHHKVRTGTRVMSGRGFRDAVQRVCEKVVERFGLWGCDRKMRTSHFMNPVRASYCVRFP